MSEAFKQKLDLQLKKEETNEAIMKPITTVKEKN